MTRKRSSSNSRSGKRPRRFRWKWKNTASKAFADDEKKNIPRNVVYNEMPAIPIDESVPTTETRRQADHLFEKIRKTSTFKNSKIGEKRLFFQRLFHATKRAMQQNGCIRYSRNRSHAKDIEIQVMDCAIEVGLFDSHRSPKGSPKMSRVVPLEPLTKYADHDPWEFDPNEQKQFVFLKDRKTEEELKIDWNHEVPRYTQECLELINRVNSEFEITYRPWESWNQDFASERRLRPVHYAVFTNSWKYHGRIYTGRYGHQSLRRFERETIEFDGVPCVELDYGGMHPRLLYHLLEIDYQDDPYSLWNKTKPEARMMTKTLISAALNAKDRTAAISAANFEMCPFTKEKDEHGQRIRKDGKALEDAYRLNRAAKKTGLKFSEIYGLAIERHEPIAKFFGADSGMRLMRLDSLIAIEVLYTFASHGIPCLGCHDSFIVPYSAKSRLLRIMKKVYFRKMGFYPIIK